MPLEVIGSLTASIMCSTVPIITSKDPGTA